MKEDLEAYMKSWVFILKARGTILGLQTGGFMARLTFIKLLWWPCRRRIKEGKTKGKETS